ncbi:MAG TPA: CDP-diacylglycerol--glycerol-3-phosphate 3-phosphatidyltransferase [Thermoleophilia bacterium]|nr:CDP-diacylglycerol--glycerol-3-phosphate 3-phosphatidyltransferase [Thermoleophilia bacterium]
MTRPNLPNSISLFRVMTVPLLMVFLLADVPGGDIVALAIFAVAAGSDSLDGYIARRRSQTTVMGAFLDPLADKLLVTAALVCLVELGELSAWVAMVVIAREFAISGLRMVAAIQDVVISASKWGKAKTVTQVLVIAVLIVEPRWLKPDWTLGGQRVSWYLVMLMLVLTVVSALDYFWHARRQLGGPAILKDPEGASPASKG